MAYPPASPANDKANGTDLVNDHPAHHNELADAIIDIVNVLGPAGVVGGASTVDGRFDAIEADNWVTQARIADDAVGLDELIYTEVETGVLTLDDNNLSIVRQEFVRLGPIVYFSVAFSAAGFNISGLVTSSRATIATGWRPAITKTGPALFRGSSRWEIGQHQIGTNGEITFPRGLALNNTVSDAIISLDGWYLLAGAEQA